MAGIRVLADEHIKFTILTAKPANPAAPTAAELNAGIDASCLVLADNFQWTAADSERVGERALCEATAAESPGIGNYNIGFSYWRWFDSVTGAADATTDLLHPVVKEKGTALWGYARRTGKPHSAAWAALDEIQLGGEFTTDTPQAPDGSGFIKYTLPCMAQAMHDFITVAAA